MAAPARGQRILTDLAVGLAVIAGAVGLGRVFVGSGSSVRLVACGIGSVALAALLERRSWLLSVLVSGFALVTAMGMLLVPYSTWWGLPTWESLGVLGGLLRLAVSEMKTQIAPTLPLGGLILAAMVATWAVGWISHSLASRARAPIAASIGPLCLFAFGDVLVDQGSRPGYSVLMLCGIMALLFADGLARVRGWGPLEIWRGPSRRAGSVTLRATKGAWGVALGAVMVAVLAPALLPGWEHASVLHPFAGPGGQKEVNPLVSIQADLNKEIPQRLFTVQASAPAYWRLLALNTFNGIVWTAPDLTAATGREVDGSAQLAEPASGTSVLNEQAFEIISFGSPWLPMAADAQRLTLEDGSARFDPSISMAVASDGLRRGDRYEVVSSAPVPDPAQLDAAPDPRLLPVERSMPPGLYQNNVGTGPLPAALKELALKWTSRADTQYRKMLALQKHLREDFTYDEAVTTPPGVNALEWFLTESRRGFCQQFAGAMAAMARSLGYPARVAVGFLPGADMGDGTYEVTTSDAHAWPEIYFVGIGWIPFEPTPGRTNPSATVYLDPAYLTQGGGSSAGQPGAAGGRLQRFAGLRWKARHATGAGFGPVPLPEAPTPWARTIFEALAAIAAIAVLAIPPAKALSRRRRIRRARTPRELVLAGYDVLARRLEDVGIARPPGQTLAEFARLRGDGSRHLGPLVAATTRAAYGQGELSADEAGAAVADSRAVRRELVREVPWTRRLVGAFRLPSRSGGRSRSGPG